MAKRGYTRDTIRGGASDWDVSRPFSSYARMLGVLLAHPVRFFEVLPKVLDVRAPGMFVVFCSVLAAAVWSVVGGVREGILALILPLPLSLALAGLYYLGTWGGRYGYAVTWRAAVYPLGFYLPLTAVPVMRWVAGIYAMVVLVSVGLATAREVPAARAAVVATLAAAIALLAGRWFFAALP